MSSWLDLGIAEAAAVVSFLLEQRTVLYIMKEPSEHRLFKDFPKEIVTAVSRCGASEDGKAVTVPSNTSKRLVVERYVETVGSRRFSKAEGILGLRLANIPRKKGGGGLYTKLGLPHLCRQKPFASFQVVAKFDRTTTKLQAMDWCIHTYGAIVSADIAFILVRFGLWAYYAPASLAHCLNRSPQGVTNNCRVKDVQAQASWVINVCPTRDIYPGTKLYCSYNSPPTR